MRYFRRVIGRLRLGSARLWRVWFRRRAETGFSWNAKYKAGPGTQERFAIAGRARQTRETRALPGALRSLVACVVIALVIAIVIIWWLPIPGELQKPPIGTLTLLDCRGREIAELASPEARAQFPVTLEKMGPWLPRVTVALEDRRFYEHRGIDWHAIAAACARNLRSRHLLSGASTITQQLVKLATGRERRSWSKKLYEAIIAWKLEHRWSKERILAEYLNRSSYGNRRIGPEAAARAYFDKPARDLTLSEAVFLSGLPQAPTRFNPWRHPDQASRKYSRSLARLVALGVITRDATIFAGIATEHRAHRATASCATLCRCGGRPEPGIAGYSDCNARSGFADNNRTLGSLTFISVESARYQAGRCGRC